MESVVILGSTGMLGSTLTRYMERVFPSVTELNRIGRSVTGRNRSIEFDVLKDNNLVDKLNQLKPDYIINAIGMIKQLIDEQNEKDIEKAQMLCFETICAATLSSKNKNGTKCLEEFIKAYPSLVARVLSIHPEYCLDGKIVSTCSDTFTKGEFEFNMPAIDFINITLGGEVTDEVTDM